ncbi:hypothetical protein HDF14_001186 [Edaphobacter lichenicola]|jgi:hypothetical protein|uniref:Uncharacterized protein n=1 Tax=Tunturiibacter gelidiferens TaxID=3069689 RepID=A0A9X0QBY7_9BACT|nr:hypothetical protein [Edaphobacter lichenicola]
MSLLAEDESNVVFAVEEMIESFCAKEHSDEVRRELVSYLVEAQ